MLAIDDHQVLLFIGISKKNSQVVAIRGDIVWMIFPTARKMLRHYELSEIFAQLLKWQGNV